MSLIHYAVTLQTFVNADEQPADGGGTFDQLRDFLPKSPNLGPFKPLAGPISSFVALVLGAITIICIVMLVVSGFRYFAAGSNPQKASQARDAAKRYAVGLLVACIFWGLILTFVISAGNSVT